MYTIITTRQFEKELVLCKKRGYDISEFRKVAQLLEKTGTLPEKYKPHKLSGNYKNCWECHIKPDWLLIYQSSPEKLVLARTGSHSELF